MAGAMKAFNTGLRDRLDGLDTRISNAESNASANSKRTTVLEEKQQTMLKGVQELQVGVKKHIAETATRSTAVEQEVAMLREELRKLQSKCMEAGSGTTPDEVIRRV